MSDVHVTGLKELNAFLDQLAPKLARNVVRGSLRAGMKVVLPVAQRNIHSVSGELAKSLKLGTRAKGGVITASVKTRVFYAKFVEFGTKPHIIRAKGGGFLSFMGIFRKEIAHPGIAKNKAFMRPALDSQAQAAVIAAAEYMKKRLATKHGLDTADIVIEGDE